MKINLRAPILRSLLIVLLLAPAAFAGITIKGRVVGVHDGDTITVLDPEKVQHKVRLAGIDAPETGQPFGQKGKQNLSRLVFGRDVTVLAGKTDRYGRTVGKVIVDGRDANLEQVKAGFAWHYKDYQNEQSAEDRAIYSEYERLARAFGMGLWADRNPQAPWLYRKVLRSPQGAVAAAAKPSLVDGKIVGNRNSNIYHWPACLGYSKIAAGNRVMFATAKDAESAGFRAAKNCSEAKP